MPDTKPADELDAEEAEEPVVEEHALPEIGNRPQFLVAGDTFYAQTDDGREVKFPLSFKTKAVREMPDDLAPIGQLFHLHSALVDQLTILDDLDYNESKEIARRYFKAYAEKQRARLGESGRSSRS